MVILNTEDLYNEIARLQCIARPTDTERIKLARAYICKRYIKLSDAINNSSTEQVLALSWNYDRKLLELILDILIHTRDNWLLENDAQRKGSLHNLVRTTLLLRREFTSIYNRNYDYRIQQDLLKEYGYEEINMWRNFKFLIQCKISLPEHNANQKYDISPDEVNSILKESFELIDNILVKEVRIGLVLQKVNSSLKSQGLSISGYLLDQHNEHEQKVRSPYRNPMKLPYLYAFTTYKREKFRIETMLNAISFALTLDSCNHKHQIALLRQLQIIGESVGNKNLSIKTKRLVDNIDWQLFVSLRNKLSHNEWDIHKNLLMHNLNMLQHFKNDLLLLQNALENLMQRHIAIGINMTSILNHYSTVWRIRNHTRDKLVCFVENLINANLIDQAQLKNLLSIADGDIREYSIPTQYIKPLIRKIFDKEDCNYENTKHLLKPFHELVNTFSDELAYHRNIEDPDQRTLKREADKLKAYQVSIRNFHDQLSYSESTYNADQKNYHYSFNHLRIIDLITREINYISKMLSPLEGSEILKLEFPEDFSRINCPLVIQALFKKAINFSSIEGNKSINNINSYFRLIGESIHLQMEGLCFGVRRREQISININCFDDLSEQEAFKIIQLCGNRCLFYSSLFKNQAIVDACLYHMARIQKYIVVLYSSKEVSTNHPLPNKQEFKALRDFIHHGLDLFETMGIPLYIFMTRYATMFLNVLFPAINKVSDSIIMNRCEQYKQEEFSYMTFRMQVSTIFTDALKEKEQILAKEFDVKCRFA